MIQEEDIGSAFTVEVGGDERSIDLTHIRPHSSYRVSVAAINAIGTGETEEVQVDTDGELDFIFLLNCYSIFCLPDAPLSTSESFLMPKLPIIVGVSLLFILIVIDLICYSTNRCGLIACFCINCLGRAPRDHKEKDVEAGRYVPESTSTSLCGYNSHLLLFYRGENNRLLDNQASR